MPIVQIKIPANHADAATQERIRQATKAHVLQSLSADQAHHDYVTVNEVVAKVGDGVPLVLVDQRPGREPWRKEKFANLVQQTIEQEMGITPDNTFVVFRESHTTHNFYVGDGFLEPFDPAAHDQE